MTKYRICYWIGSKPYVGFSDNLKDAKVPGFLRIATDAVENKSVVKKYIAWKSVVMVEEMKPDLSPPAKND